MSPQIKELLARPSLERLNDWANIGPVQRVALEEFAELIVKQCAKVGSHYGGNVGHLILYDFGVEP